MVASVDVVIERRSLTELRMIMFRRRRVGGSQIVSNVMFFQFFGVICERP